MEIGLLQKIVAEENSQSRSLTDSLFKLEKTCRLSTGSKISLVSRAASTGNSASLLV